MIILGIDPGTINLGYAILNTTNSNSVNKLTLLNAGIITTKSKSKVLLEQILNMEKSFSFLFDKYDIDEVSIEDIFFAHNPKTAIKLAQFRGAILLKMSQLIKTDKIFQYTPLQVKKAISGNGKSTKEQVAFMVKKILNIKGEIKPLDITDAIAIAITHSQRIKINKKLL